MEQQHNNKTAIQIILLYIFIQVSTVVIAQILPETIRLDGIIWSNIILFSLGALGMIYLTVKRQFYFLFEQPVKSNLFSTIVWGVLGTFIALIAQTAATLIEVNFLGTPLDSQNTQAILAILERYPYFVVLTSIAGPIMEEFVFRKAIFGTAVGKTGVIGAAVINSLLFAFIHLDGRILVYSSMALVFSWLYYKTKNIWTPIIAHCLMNLIAVLANNLPIN